MKRFKTTNDIQIPNRIIDQVIGQENAVDIIKKAAKQHRNILLIGEPGVGKTMLAQAMAQLLPVTDLEDVLVYRNVNDENKPIVKTVKTYPKPPETGKPLGDGQGRQMVQKEKLRSRLDTGTTKNNITPIVIVIVALIFIASITGIFGGYELLVLAALVLGVLIFGAMALFVTGFRRAGVMPGMFETSEPKLVVDNTGRESAPFVDGTGARAGALFGDVKHDPLQSGGLGTPPHLRVESGAVHRANHGVLYVDEVASLEPRSQQELLTALQEKKYPITGQSELSSGAIVRTEPVPCDFILVAAGNLMDLQKMHPALRSRIRGYGYEVYMESSMPDTPANVDRLLRFVAQEVKKDGRIPPFDYDAAMEIIEEARRRSGRKNRLSLILRDLGGLVRAAGDIAKEKNHAAVGVDDVKAAMALAKPIEAQFVDQSLEYRKDYKIFTSKGYAIGKVNGLAVIGSSHLSTGVIIPIVAEVTPAGSRSEGKLIATGKLGKIAQEAVKNISAVIKRHMNRDVASYDIHVQFLQTYEGVEGDSASISVAVSVISAMEGIPIDQEVAMTGSLSVRGDVLPVGGVTNKVKAAIEAGMKYVIVPKSNEKDVYIDRAELKKIKIIPARNIAEVLQYALKKSPRRDAIIKELRQYINKDSIEKPPLVIKQTDGHVEKEEEKVTKSQRRRTRPRRSSKA